MQKKGMNTIKLGEILKKLFLLCSYDLAPKSGLNLLIEPQPEVAPNFKKNEITSNANWRKW